MPIGRSRLRLEFTSADKSFSRFKKTSTGRSIALESPNHFLWASDYPHVDSTWPNSRDAIDRALAGLEDWLVRRIVCDNAGDLYRC